MIFIPGQQTSDPFHNSALEEYCLRHLPLDEPIFLMYVNDTAVIIGRNQNIFEETDPDYLERNGIQLVRRLSGGGAVYHDAGNLNFSFIVPGRRDIHHFQKFTGPIVRTLARFGIEATMQPNGSLFVGEKKISGHAQYAAADRLLSHGTLLFAADLGSLSPALRPKVNPAESKGVASIRSPVMNVRPLLPAGIQLADLQRAILQELFADEVTEYQLTAAEQTAIQQLAAEQYRSWEWIYGRNPRFVLQLDGRVPAGDIEIRLEIDKGRMREMDIFCDFFDKRQPAQLAEQLLGLKYDAAALLDRLSQIDLDAYFGPISAVEFVEMLYPNHSS